MPLKQVLVARGAGAATCLSAILLCPPVGPARHSPAMQGHVRLLLSARLGGGRWSWAGSHRAKVLGAAYGFYQEGMVGVFVSPVWAVTGGLQLRYAAFALNAPEEAYSIGLKLGILGEIGRGREVEGQPGTGRISFLAATASTELALLREGITPPGDRRQLGEQVASGRGVGSESRPGDDSLVLL